MEPFSILAPLFFSVNLSPNAILWTGNVACHHGLAMLPVLWNYWIGTHINTQIWTCFFTMSDQKFKATNTIWFWYTRAKRNMSFARALNMNERSEANFFYVKSTVALTSSIWPEMDIRPISQYPKFGYEYPNIPIWERQYPNIRGKMTNIPISQLGLHPPRRVAWLMTYH